MIYERTFTWDSFVKPELVLRIAVRSPHTVRHRYLPTRLASQIADGGGKAIAFKRPVQTRDHVARVLLDGFHGIGPYNHGKLHFEAARLNGETGIVIRSGDETVAALCIQLRHGKLARMYAVRNPDKLAWV